MRLKGTVKDLLPVADLTPISMCQFVLWYQSLQFIIFFLNYWHLCIRQVFIWMF